jgi:23S rRNA (uracil1939-C5)-methyltransferase
MNTEFIPLKIESLSHDGRGIAHYNGKITFVNNALPGESVFVKIIKQHKKFNEATADIIEKANPDRVIAECPHFGICGGCALQHLDANAQIKLKQNVLLEQLKHFGRVEPKEILPPLTGPIWGYRHKARLSVKYVQAKNSALVGFHEKNGRFVADLKACITLHPHVGQLITPLKNLITDLTIRDGIAQIEVAIGDDKTALIFRHLKTPAQTDLDKLCQFAHQHDLSIFLQPGNSDSIHLLYPQPQTTEDEFISYQLTHSDLKLFFHPNEFSQINPDINHKMIKRAIELLEPEQTDDILDLYCGFGNFTLPLARLCRTIVGVDGNHKAIECGKKNASYNQINNATFYSSELTETCQYQPWAKNTYQKLLLDPPRVGAEPILPLIAKLKPKKIVYISCNPATFARDAGELVNVYKYKLLQCGVMDMFPHTKHVEAIALFVK